MPVIAQSDIEAILLRDLTVTEEAYVDRLTEMAVAQVEGMFPGLSIDSGLIEDEVIAYNDADVMWTARYPVSEITSLSIDGTEAETTTYRYNEKGRIELGRWGYVAEFELNLTGLAPWSEITVTYRYGITPTPPDLAAAAAAVVAAHLRRQGNNPTGVASKTLGAFSVTYEQAASEALGLAPPPAALLSRWNRTRAVSVPLVRHR